MRKPDETLITRRGVLQAGLAALGTGALRQSALAGEATSVGFTIGIYADAHYADRKHAGTRYYRDSAAKLTTFVQAMNQAKPAFVIELGDFVDSAPTFEIEMGFLEHIEKIYSGFAGKRYHVIGNHDVARFSKEQFMAGAGMKAAHYAFDCGPYHFVVLDANYNKDFTPYCAGKFKWTETYISPAQQKWLQADLKRTTKKTIAFVHQCLDDEKGSHGVKNGPDVRKILEESGKVLAVFQGHNHGGAFRKINGISYLTLRAMVEGPGPKNNAYALATVWPCGRIEVRGFDKQPSRAF